MTADVEQLLSRAYVPLLSQIVEVIARGLPGDQLDQLLREAGRNLASDLSTGRPPARLSARVRAASRLLDAQLGAVTHVEENGKFIIRGSGCRCGADWKHRAVCRAMESLVETLVGAPTHECCERTGRPLCCFEISKTATTKRRADISGRG